MTVSDLTMRLAYHLGSDFTVRVVIVGSITILRYKTKELVFHRPHPTNWHIPHSLEGTEHVQTAKLLGVIFQSGFKFVDHVRIRLLYVFICPIAIAYSYGTDNKIGLRLSVCVTVCLSVCHHSHGRISLSIFTKFDTEV